MRFIYVELFQAKVTNCFTQAVYQNSDLIFIVFAIIFISGDKIALNKVMAGTGFGVNMNMSAPEMLNFCK